MDTPEVWSPPTLDALLQLLLLLLSTTMLPTSWSKFSIMSQPVTSIQPPIWCGVHIQDIQSAPALESIQMWPEFSASTTILLVIAMATLAPGTMILVTPGAVIMILPLLPPVRDAAHARLLLILPMILPEFTPQNWDNKEISQIALSPTSSLLIKISYSTPSISKINITTMAGIRPQKVTLEPLTKESTLPTEQLGSTEIYMLPHRSTPFGRLSKRRAASWCNTTQPALWLEHMRLPLISLDPTFSSLEILMS